MRRQHFFWITLLLLLVQTITFIEPAASQDSAFHPIPLANNISLEAFVASETVPTYLDQITYNPQDAQYFDLVNDAYQLNDAELALLAENGFVVTDRLFYEDFIHAYAWIYWKDLPVIVTTDSILQSVHYAFSEILIRTEISVLAPMLHSMLTETLSKLRQYDAPTPETVQAQADLDTYLSVALALLEGAETSPNADATPYVQQAMTAEGISGFALFDSPNRQIDFTRFEPVGHYYRFPTYYRAMTWLSQIDIRLIDYTESGDVVLNTPAVVAAVLLHDMMNSAGTRQTWDDMESILQRMFGLSDNTTLADIDRLIADAGFNAAQDVFAMDEAALLDLLLTNEYGAQQINGQVINVSPMRDEPLPRPLSFMLIGQRFTIDSYIMSNLTFDRLKADDTLIRRPFPATMDVMYALGNNRAVTHLQPELETYNYQGALQAQRDLVDNVAPEFWSSSSSVQWLNMLRYLSTDTTSANYPQVMQTAAWADKMLQTQLASWAQLRHDTILYSKESYTGNVLCEYPAGYVEPYPEFYAAVAKYARDSYWFFSSLPSLNSRADDVAVTAIDYYQHLENVALQLESMSQKIVNHEPFSPEEEAFLRDITVLQSQDTLCGLRQEEWDGWYADLYPWYEDKNLASIDDYNPVTIATIHTNTNTQDAALLPPGVLHVGTGRVATQLFVVNTHDGLMIYAGPAFTYYEFVQEGFPPQRLNDVDWMYRWTATPPPDWTSSFRIPIGEDTQPLIPGRE